MADYISREAAIDALEGCQQYKVSTEDYAVDYAQAKTELMMLPTADVRENVRGKWMEAAWENINTGELRKGRRCSICGSGYFRYDVSVNTVSDIPNFCPNCGADMRGDK